MKKILVSGSLAYDYVMAFPGRFREHILPDKLHILSVMFLIDSFNRNYGGTGGNIAYTLGKINAQPILLASIGNDSEAYMTHLQKSSVPTSYIKMQETATGSAHIITDRDDNQITAFHPGAMEGARNMSLNDVSEEVALTIIAPNDLEAMKRHAQESHELGIPYVFDPGQQTTTFSPEETRALLEKASFLIANDYEHELIRDKTGYSLRDIVNLPSMKAAITTLGSRGARVTTKEEEIEVSGVQVEKVIDPTGAGDAYRAGFFAAYVAGASPRECAQAGNVSALFAIEHHGTQNPALDRESYVKRYTNAYGTDVPF